MSGAPAAPAAPAPSNPWGQYPCLVCSKLREEKGDLQRRLVKAEAERDRLRAKLQRKKEQRNMLRNSLDSEQFILGKLDHLIRKRERDDRPFEPGTPQDEIIGRALESPTHQAFNITVQGGGVINIAGQGSPRANDPVTPGPPAAKRRLFDRTGDVADVDDDEDFRDDE
jgi:hypothetical protein